MMDPQTLHFKGFISEIDYHFARFMARFETRNPDRVALAAALLSRATALGHVCVDLNHLDDPGSVEDAKAHRLDLDTDLDLWMSTLNNALTVGRPGDFKPLILDGKRLYLHRYWQYEQRVAHAILKRCRSVRVSNTTCDLNDALRKIFSEGDDLQHRAILSALNQGFSVISGGPGTGKTYTIAKLLLLLHSAGQGHDLRLRLAAPTGKATMRLQQSIEATLSAMGHSRQEIHMFMGGDVQTLHRLLGALSDQSGFRYNADHPLAVDVVIVDEASMVDLAMMAALTAALPPKAQLVLIGDKNQLASVEAGAVLGDICSGVNRRLPSKDRETTEWGRNSALAGRIVVLKKSYRFAAHSGIDDLAAAINNGETDTALALLKNRDIPNISFKAISNLSMLEMSVADLATRAIAPLFNAPNPLVAFDRMAHHMILTPLRLGPYGMLNLNRYVENALIKIGLIPQLRSLDDPWYPGRPVMIGRNDYYHNLFNGDMGVAMASGKDSGSQVTVFFPDGTNGIKAIASSQLPPHETAYAMTVHKSQGSEFDHVVLVLPDRKMALLTRELIYTAVTRAKQSVTIWGSEQILRQGIEQLTRRTSGLGSLLWKSAKD